MRTRAAVPALMALLLLCGGVLGYWVVEDTRGESPCAPPRVAMEDPVNTGAPRRAPLPEPEVLPPAPKLDPAQPAGPQPKPAPQPVTPAAAEEAIRQKLEALNGREPSAEELAALQEAIKTMATELKAETGPTPQLPFRFTATISGTVVDAAGSPVAEADVLVSTRVQWAAAEETKVVQGARRERRIASSPPVMARTDAAGNFTLAYNQGFSREVRDITFGVQGRGAHGVKSPGVEFTLREGESRTDLRLEIPATGGLTGRVVDEYGVGVSARVMAALETDKSREGYIHSDFGGSSGQWMVTDSDGRFRMPAMVPGSYVLTVVASGYQYDGKAGSATVVAGRDSSFAADIVLRTHTAARVTLVCAGRNLAGVGLSAVYYDAAGNRLRTGGWANVSKDGTALFAGAPVEAAFFEITGSGFENSGRIACSIRAGLHNDLGTVSLVAREMPVPPRELEDRSDYDGKPGLKVRG